MTLNVLGKKEKHALVFRSYKPLLEDQFKKPKQSGNHPIEPVKENLSQRFYLTDWKIEKRSQREKSG